MKLSRHENCAVFGQNYISQHFIRGPGKITNLRHFIFAVRAKIWTSWHLNFAVQRKNKNCLFLVIETINVGVI